MKKRLFVLPLALLILILVVAFPASADTPSSIRVYLRRLQVEDTLHVTVKGQYATQDGRLSFSDGAKLVVVLRGDQLVLHTGQTAVVMGSSIKLVRPNKETGKSDVFIRKDSDTIARWGLLQLYQKVDEAATDAQVKEQAKVSLEYYNRVLQQLKFTSLGVNSLRAGQLLLVNINDLDGDPFRKYVMLEKVSHTWENDLHTMELEAKAL